MKDFLPDYAHPFIEVITIALQIALIVFVALLLRSMLHRLINRISEDKQLPLEFAIGGRRVVGGGGRVDAAAAVNVNVVIVVVVVAGTQAVFQSRAIQTYQNPDGVLADGPVVVACSRHPLIAPLVVVVVVVVARAIFFVAIATKVVVVVVVPPLASQRLLLLFP